MHLKWKPKVSCGPLVALQEVAEKPKKLVAVLVGLYSQIGTTAVGEASGGCLASCRSETCCCHLSPSR